MTQATEPQDAHWSGLMAAAQKGDSGAYDRLLRAIVPFVRSLVRRALSDPDAVEDVVQEVLLTVHRVRHTYEPARPFSPWLATIVSRRAVDFIRRRGRIVQHETSDEHAYVTFSDVTANNEGGYDHVSDAQIQYWLQELPAGQRQALELLKLRELSLAEASAVSGQSVGSLKVSVHRAIKALRAKLKPGSESVRS